MPSGQHSIPVGRRPRHFGASAASRRETPLSHDPPSSYHRSVSRSHPVAISMTSQGSTLMKPGAANVAASVVLEGSDPEPQADPGKKRSWSFPGKVTPCGRERPFFQVGLNQLRDRMTLVWFESPVYSGRDARDRLTAGDRSCAAGVPVYPVQRLGPWISPRSFSERK
jgi:hypothetical protein